MRARAPMQLILDPDVNPGDPIGSEVVLNYDEDDFNLKNGKLKTVDLNITGQGAIGVREADWTLGEDDKKLRVIRLDVSEDFQQTGGVLAIRNQGNGRIPFFQIGSGLSSNGLFTFDGAQTLSVPFIKLTESFVLSGNYAATCSYVLQAYQSQVGSGIDISEAINSRRIVSVRCEPSSLFVNGANQLEVKIDPSGGLKKDPGLGLDTRLDPSGCIKVDPGLGMDVRTEDMSLSKVAGVLQVNLSETQRALTKVADGITVNVDPSGSLKIDNVLGLDTRLHPTGAIENVTGMGLKWKPDPLGPLFCDLGGADLRLAPVSGLMKGTQGLSVQVDPTGALSIDGSLGLDIRVDGLTITKSLAGLQGNYRGDVDGDITVTPAGIILCNISTGAGLQKIGTVISLLPEVEDKLNQVDDALDAAEGAQNTANNAKTIADTAAETAGELADKLGDLSSVIDTVGDLSKQIGIAVGTSALTSATVTALSATALGVLAKSQAQALIASKVGAATGIAAAFAGAFGVLGGLIGGSIGKKGNTINHISNNTYNIGTIKEKDTDDEEDTYLYGFTLGCGSDYNIDLYPDRALNPATFMPLLNSGLQPVESNSIRTGQLTIVGDLGVAGNVHAINMFIDSKPVATQEFVVSKNYLTSVSLTGFATESYVNNRGFITSAALSPYLTIAAAANTYVTIPSLTTTLNSYVTNTNLSTTLGSYVTNANLSTTLGSYVTNSSLTSSLSAKQDILLPGKGIIKTGSTISVHEIQSLTDLSVTRNLVSSGDIYGDNVPKLYPPVPLPAPPTPEQTNTSTLTSAAYGNGPYVTTQSSAPSNNWATWSWYRSLTGAPGSQFSSESRYVSGTSYGLEGGTTNISTTNVQIKRGFISSAPFKKLDALPRDIATMSIGGVNYPVLKAGSVTLTITISQCWVNSQSAASLIHNWGYSILRNGSYGDTVRLSFTMGGQGVLSSSVRNWSGSITVLDGDVIIPFYSITGSSSSGSYNCGSTWSQFKIEGKEALNSTTGLYIGSVSTTSDAVVCKGEYIQVQYPYPLKLRSWEYTAQLGHPETFVICASHDGTTWTTLYNQANPLTWTTDSQTFVVNSPIHYSYYRFVCLTTTGYN